MCENNKVKQRYLLQAFKDPLLFADVRELGNGAAYEVRSGRFADVPQAWCHLGLKTFSLLVL